MREQRVGNLIVSSGKTLIANLFRGAESQPVTHMAVGTGSSKPRSTDAMLDDEVQPRRAFDKDFLAEEKSAFLVLRDSAKKDALRITSRLSGEAGNGISVEVNRTDSDRFSLSVRGETDDGMVEESFENLAMDARDGKFVEKLVNEDSQLIAVRRIVNSVPVNMKETRLTEGQDAVVTLGATFGYEDCNGPVSEAGIFNAETEGTMYNRVVFPEINKTDKLTLSLIWNISF